MGYGQGNTCTGRGQMNKNLKVRAFVTVLLAAFCGCAAPADDSPPDPAMVEGLIAEMELVFAETSGMVEHTRTVHRFALDIQAGEGGDLAVVNASAILHDIGIPRAREVHGSSAGQYQEIEGPPIAREILTRNRFSPEQIDHICGIVANHHSDGDPDIGNTIEFKILWDADWLVNFPGRHRDKTLLEKEEAIGEVFKTETGRQLARQLFLE
jgi:hypothetical protein